MRYTKYKKLYKVSCFGLNDELRSSSESQYMTPGSSYTNGKTCRFNLNGAFNDVILSKNARLILESTYFPAVTNTTSSYINVRIVTSSEDKIFDTAKQTSGNPLLVTFPSASSIINNSELFYNFNVPTNFLLKGYIDVEIEVPIVNTNITFTGGALNRFMLTFVIVDEDDEEIKDPNIAQTVDYKNYGRLGMPIRTPLT